MTTITTRTGTYYDEPDTMLIIEATDNGQVISALYANPDTRQIMAIETIEERQGEGHARSLIDYAVDNNIELYHSPEWSCTPKAGHSPKPAMILKSSTMRTHTAGKNTKQPSQPNPHPRQKGHPP